MSNLKSPGSPATLSEKGNDIGTTSHPPRSPEATSEQFESTYQSRPIQNADCTLSEAYADENVEVDAHELSVKNLQPLEELISPLGVVTPQLMNSFYRFHTAVFNNQGGRPNSKIRDRLNEFRFSLKYLWGEGGASIVTYLESVHDIVTDADFLLRSMKKGRNAAALVSKLKGSISRCADAAQNLEVNCETILLKWPKCHKFINVASKQLPPAPHSRNLVESPSTSPCTDGHQASFFSAVKGVLSQFYSGADSYDNRETDDDRYYKTKDDKRPGNYHGGEQGVYRADDGGRSRKHTGKKSFGNIDTKQGGPSSQASPQSESEYWEETMLEAAHPNGDIEAEQIPVLLLQLKTHLAQNATFWKVHKTALITYLTAVGSSKNVAPLSLPDVNEAAAILPKVISEVKAASQMLLEPITD